jgi:thioredoxin-dependent peroxiredoxin
MPIPALGATAPDFELPTAAGTPLRLSSLRGGLVVLFFYAEDDTEGCTIENQQFSLLRPAFEALGSTLIGVSEDSVERHRRFCSKHGIDVTLVADPDHVAIEAYGVWGPKVTFGHHLVGLIRSTFLIGTDGRILAHWHVTRIKGHADKVLEAVWQTTEKH